VGWLNPSHLLAWFWLPLWILQKGQPADSDVAPIIIAAPHSSLFEQQQQQQNNTSTEVVMGDSMLYLLEEIQIRPDRLYSILEVFIAWNVPWLLLLLFFCTCLFLLLVTSAFHFHYVIFIHPGNTLCNMRFLPFFLSFFLSFFI